MVSRAKSGDRQTNVCTPHPIGRPGDLLSRRESRDLQPVLVPAADLRVCRGFG